MKKRIFYYLCVLGVIFSFIFFGTANAMGSRGSGEKVEFNLEVNVPLTGNLAFLGVPTKNAFIIAHEDLKERLDKENVSINLIFGDSQGSPKTAVTVHNQNKALKKINGLFSMLSAQTLALKPLAERENIFYIASTVDPSVCENSKNLIRPYYSFGTEGKAMLEVISEKKPEKVGIIYSTDPATSFEVERVVLPGLKGMNIPVTVETYRVRNRDFRTQILSIKQAAPDIILTYGFGVDIPFLINSLKEQQVYDKAMLIGPIGVSDALRFKPAKDFAGMYYFDPAFLHVEKQTQEYQAFKAKCIERFGAKQFTHASAYTYDTYVFLSEAIIATRSTDASVIMKELTNKKLTGLAGIYKFDETGDCNPPVGFSHITEDGEIKLLRVFNGK